jgi:hypothetical protein
MSTSFAAAITRLNASVLKCLPNAQAVIGGVSYDVLLSDPYVSASVGLGMATSQPTIALATANVPTAPEGQAITVNNVPYIIGPHQPDGHGMSVLLLERAP